MCVYAPRWSGAASILAGVEGGGGRGGRRLVDGPDAVGSAGYTGNEMVTQRTTAVAGMLESIKRDSLCYRKHSGGAVGALHSVQRRNTAAPRHGTRFERYLDTQYWA